MPSHNSNGGRGGPWGSEADPGSDLENLVRQGQNRLKQIMPSGSPRGLIILAVLALLGLGAWSAYYTVPSDSVAVVQRFGKYLKDVTPGLHFKLPLGIDAATIVPVKRQLKQEFCRSSGPRVRGLVGRDFVEPFWSDYDGKLLSEIPERPRGPAPTI